MIKVMKFNGKVVSGYLISDEGKVFFGKDRKETKPYLSKGQYYFNLILNKKMVPLNALDLILMNFEDKPTNGFYKAAFKNTSLLKDFLNISNLYWKKEEEEKQEYLLPKEELKKMKSVFIQGILTNYLVSRKGEVYSLEGKKVKVLISRKGRPYLEVNMPYSLGIKKMFLSDIVIEAYKLPPKDFIENYHQSFLDGDKKNCSENNIILWKEGNSGIAQRKLVKVFKDGNFFGAFESITKCSSIINIPRRRISELLKNGLSKNGFMIQEFKMW